MPESSSAKRKSDRVEKKRSAILSIALEIFAREGFRNTDVQVIADLAGVGKGTVYRHFGNKEQLFLATAKFSVARLGEFIVEQLGLESASGPINGPVGVRVRKIALACARYYELHPEAVEIMIQERAEFREQVFPSHLMYRAETRAGFEDFLRRGVATGEIRDVDIKQATDAFADLLFGCAVSGCLEGTRNRIVERVTHAIDIFLNGLLIPAQSSQFDGPGSRLQESVGD